MTAPIHSRKEPSSSMDIRIRVITAASVCPVTAPVPLLSPARGICSGGFGTPSTGYRCPDGRPADHLSTTTRIRRRRRRWKGTDVADKDVIKGDKVSWQTHGTTTQGEVEKEITSDTEAAGRTVRASDDDPQYLVRSDKSGREAVHKPGALHKES